LQASEGPWLQFGYSQASNPNKVAETESQAQPDCWQGDDELRLIACHCLATDDTDGVLGLGPRPVKRVIRLGYLGQEPIPYLIAMLVN